MWLIPFLATSILIVLFVSGGYTFFTACRRQKERPWLDKEAIAKTSYGKYSDLIQMSHKWLRDHGAQDVYMESRDGLNLHGHYIPAKDPRGTVILAHGYRSTKLVDFGLFLELYHQLGMNLLIPDQRAHGKSEGKYITFGVKESGDFLQWLEYHNEHFSDCPVILSGISMGASTVMYLADRKLPQNVKGLIVDCGFTSPADIIGKVFKDVTHLPPKPSLWIADLFARLFAGFSLYERSSLRSLPRNTLPIIMVHGTADHFVPCSMTEQGYAVCNGPKQLFLAQDAGHGVSMLIEPEKYEKLIIEFLDKYL